MIEKIHTYCHNCKTIRLHIIEKTIDKIKFRCTTCKDISHQYNKNDYENYEKNLVQKYLR